MAKAIWNGVVLAESDQGTVVEGNYYFPADSIHQVYFKASDKHTVCSWKGQASYYDLDVNGQVLKNGAWFYPTPKDAAQKIANHVAFVRNVTVEQ